jgi:phytoene dehydrogenase-like protein
MEVLYGVENPVFKDLKRDTKFIFKQLLPWLPKFIFTVGKINRMNMPVEDYLDSIIKNKSLKDIISQHFFKHTPTFFALSYFSLYLDYFYPKGGVGKLAEVLEDKIKELGGEIKNETLITEVISDTKELKDDRGISYYYDDMIWAADLKTLYTITKTEGLSLNIDKKFKETKELMLSSKGGESVFTLFLELDEPPDSFRSIASGHFFYTPSKKGLGATHTKDLDLILNNFDKTNKQEILTWLDRFVSLNTFEISIPVLKDPDLAPAGKTGVIISLLAEYSLFKKIQDDGWYDEFRNALETRIIEVISKSVYPMLKNKIINQFSFTPISVKNRINSSEGAIVGWSFDQELPVISKIQHSARSVVSPIPSIFHAGQWAYSPAGVPMAILTGKLAANKIIDKK